MKEESRRVPGGLVVIFEGIDGVGKTTQLNLAATALQSAGWSVHATRGHGGTPIGEDLRAVSLSDVYRPAETDLYISRAMHEALARDVRKRRADGEIILIDRGPLSLAAYQLYGDGADPEIASREIELDIKCFGAELLVTYTAAVDLSLQRARQRSGAKSDYFESKPHGYFEAVSRGFTEAGERYGATFIDAERPIEAVHQDTMSAIKAALAAASES